MKLFGFWVPIVLALHAPVSLSLAYPRNTRSQSLTLTSPTIISQGNLTEMGLGHTYPSYPTSCLPGPQQGPQIRPSELPNIISDCLWILREDLLQQGNLLFQDLVFGPTTFKDQSGNRYPSRWHHGQCVFNVATLERTQKQTLQLFNVVLAANKIVKECLEEQRIPRGGTTQIGSPNSSFYVSVLGKGAKNTVSESNMSLLLLSNLDSSTQNLRDSRPRTKSSAELSNRDYDTNDSSVSVLSDVSMGKRASDPQHSSWLSTGTRSLRLAGARTSPNLIVPPNNLSGIVRAPNWPVQCFNPQSLRLKPTAGADCQFIIDEIILRYPNPMSPQTFGYGPSADVDLSQPENERWAAGFCVIFVRAIDKTRTDTFRMVDVATAAQRIVQECITDAKYAVGGFAGVGTSAHNFFVGVGAPPKMGTGDPWTLRHPSSVDLVSDRIQ